MTNSEIFDAYAAAFEKAYVDDDWSVVEPFFNENAVYQVNLAPPMGARLEGRRAILAYFKTVLDGFDRHFDRRELAFLEGPRQEGDTLWFRGRATYSSAGVEDLVIDSEETIVFEEGRICRIEDHYEPALMDVVDGYLAKHGDALGIEHD